MLSSNALVYVSSTPSSWAGNYVITNGNSTSMYVLTGVTPSSNGAEIENSSNATAYSSTGMSLSNNAGATDLLVTWLYKMTINDSNYRIAAVIGIMVFVVTAVISLIVYNAIPSVRDEEGFQ